MNKSLIFLVVFLSAFLQAQENGFDGNGHSGWENEGSGDQSSSDNNNYDTGGDSNFPPGFTYNGDNNNFNSPSYTKLAADYIEECDITEILQNI